MDIRCIIHINDRYNNDKLIQCREEQFKKIKEFRDHWIELDNIQQVVAKKILDLEDLDPSFGYHSSCYSIFISQYHLKLARKRAELGKKIIVPDNDGSTDGCDGEVGDALHSDRDNILQSLDVINKDISLRSKSKVSSSKVPSRSKHVLPPVCMICGKSRKQKTLRGKRVDEKLSLCQTSAEVFLNCAKENAEAGDEAAKNILIQVDGRDPVALEVRYHNSCFNHFKYAAEFRIKKRENQNVPKPVPALHEAYQNFCREVIDNRVAQGEAIRLNNLRDLFLGFVNDRENYETYSTQSLKNRLKKSHPELQFYKTSFNESEIVVCNDSPCVDLSVACDNDDDLSSVRSEQIESESHISHDTDAESLAPSSSTVQSPDLSPISSRAPSPDPSPHPPSHQSQRRPQRQVPNQSGSLEHHEVRDIFMASQIVKRDVKDAKEITSWPPTEDDISSSVVSDIVPSCLFNLIAWSAGVSDEVSGEKVNVSESQELKINSICQDIISLSSGGRKKMPKQVALSMTIRHQTGDKSLINTLNALGHCMSHTFTLSHDTALSQQQLLYRSIIPPGIQPKKFTIVVFDNNDFGEQTLSGKGTSHNTNGIIIQRFTEVPNERRQSIARDQSVPSLEENVTIYASGQRQGPNIRGRPTLLVFCLGLF